MHFYSGIVTVRGRRDSSCDRELVDPVDEAGMSESDESEISIILLRSRILFVDKKRLMLMLM